ncbi:neutral/alkaline non-lysosomal ceramidase N-terminal domain-containing protein [[Mycobacterium] nativiensis]|uniref:Neutral ceramidase n=1 Tax=[Mycobacterium] nativiensis TaxID=2855503 RepID=A0ABU5XUA9_9MYCO|nr:neutral/alkaline non-lysosomal ceramidase N-terminal domain-containing protein [Mycolicibacter sp. MYC340]MEB3030596.1 neutral/alkaline non-lysosomal ceramidase N-terminal domain-containing protein [Mycolicibacter sp. MYC340]
MPENYRVGRGIADITGEPAECGMLGYGVAGQQTTGLHNRLRARAFVIAHPSPAGTDSRILLVVCEVPLLLESIHHDVLARLAATYAELYTFRNVMLTATHTHCGPGGYGDHRIYNSNTDGFRPQTFAAIVDGICEAVAQAHADLAPATLSLAVGRLHDASSNRSPSAFARNPEADRAHFPDEIDPQTTLLRIERDGRLVGAVNWFATHGTSMTNRNTLISGDNKGYAAYQWERLQHQVDYLAPTAPEFIAAFAQTNSGDMSPNLNHRPGSGPTEDEFENTRIIGSRQAAAATELTIGHGSPVSGGLEALTTYVDLSDFEVRPEFTGDGRAHRTGPVLAGAAALAGTDEGPGPGYPLVRQGRNRVVDWLMANSVYRISPRLRDSHAPKAPTLPGNRLNKALSLMPTGGPVQLLRIGQLYLIGLPAEVTIVAGLRLRRTVADIVGAELQNVLVAGYSNGYLHYVTTPEEYQEQRYEGGSTMFGRWELAALQQVAAGLATAMRDGRPAPAGCPATEPSRKRTSRRRARPDEPIAGHRFGDVLERPRADYQPGATVQAVFAGAYPNNDLHRGGTYLRVERETEDGWRTIADDGDWSTTFRWRRKGRRGSTITVTWAVPAETPTGHYRLRYQGDARDADGRISAFTGATEAFDISPKR